MFVELLITIKRSFNVRENDIDMQKTNKTFDTITFDGYNLWSTISMRMWEKMQFFFKMIERYS